ncbi:HlyD family secretion protein [Parasphingorhabdus halotolerans]|uniref:HlyD family secretion protein n=1 Tax=Parasphingorhabdus halotolerans TaxID=2725558 RepID=UPI001FE73A81|nr:biotin/lipoyl-binding protein [Parasphingorhabdus halotolerans]
MADNPNPEMDVLEPQIALANQSNTKRSLSRRILTILLMLSVPLALAGFGVYYWITSARYASTDNAYVQQNIVSISPEIGGKIVEVAVSESQLVKTGDLLFAIDPVPFELAVSQANARIAGAQVDVQSLQADYQVSGVDIEVARKDIEFALANYNRQAALMERGFNTRAKMEVAQNEVDRARAELRSAQANVFAKKARLSNGPAAPGENPDVANAKVEKEQALLNLARTRVRAPFRDESHNQRGCKWGK